MSKQQELPEWATPGSKVVIVTHGSRWSAPRRLAVTVSRVTATQVIITTRNFQGYEIWTRRFKGDSWSNTLSEIGGQSGDYNFSQLVPADDPRLAEWEAQDTSDAAKREARYTTDDFTKRPSREAAQEAILALTTYLATAE